MAIQLTTAFLFYALVASALAALLVLVMFVMRKRIGLVIRLVAEAQKTLADMPVLFLLPVFAILFLCLFLAYWLVTALMIYSFGEYNSASFLFLDEYVSKLTLSRVMWAYHLVALVWVSEFIFACQAMVISGSVARWYFARDKQSLRAPVCGALSRLLVYHMGSVAFGSFVITLIRLPRYILMTIQRK